jgi:DNA topoisomerase-3
MKENGIGRPSTRANIIETLFKRNYIVRLRKNLMPTATGIELIDTISNDLLKSVELTGIWEKKLRQIEKGEYDAKNFMDEMKQMVFQLVVEVKKESRKAITIVEQEAEKPQKAKKKAPRKQVLVKELVCPQCKKGKLLKGSSAYGCSMYKEGCTFKIPFENYGKKLTEKQFTALIQKGQTPQIKGFKKGSEKVDGKLRLTSDFKVELEIKASDKTAKPRDKLICPRCNKGEMLKGKSAWGCSGYKEGCKFIVPFAELEEKFGNVELTPEIIKGLLEKQ